MKELLKVIGNYDVVAGIGFNVVNQIVSGLYQSYAIPHEISIPEVFDQSVQQTLLNDLKSSLTGLPQGALLGDFSVRQTPAMREVATTPYVIVNVPFSLGFRQSENAPDTTLLSGMLYLPAVCGATVRDGVVALTVSSPSLQSPPANLPSASLQASNSSSAQPSSAQAGAAVATLLGKAFGHFLLDAIVVSPFISIPAPPDASSGSAALVDVRTSTAQDIPSGPTPAILAGVQYPSAGKPAGMPQALLQLKTTYTANLYVWVNTTSGVAAPYEARLRASGVAGLISHTPILRTELVPAASQFASSLANSVLALSAFVKLSSDEADRFVYARFLSKPPNMLTATPLSQVTVQLFDLDAPAPAHDDAKIPATGTTTRTTAKSITTTTTTYQAPTANELLGTAETDWDGRAIFVLRPGAGTFAGTITTTTEVEQFGDPAGDQESERQQTVAEKYPDLFFHVSSPLVEGDTLKMPNGLFVNYAGKRLGTPAEPVTYTFIREPEVNPGNFAHGSASPTKGLQHHSKRSHA